MENLKQEQCCRFHYHIGGPIILDWRDWVDREFDTAPYGQVYPLVVLL